MCECLKILVLGLFAPQKLKARMGSGCCKASPETADGPVRKATGYVVAIDFGTTFSGFAYAQRSNPRVREFFGWPGEGQRKYSKTPTALYYVSKEENGPYNVVQWGWPALKTFAMESRKATAVLHQHEGGSFGQEMRHIRINSTGATGHSEQKYGLFVTHFKLQLHADCNPDFQLSQCTSLHLPGGLTAEQLVVDYLKKMGDFIMDHLRKSYDNGLGMDAVEWCLTVPSVSNEKTKHKMKECAQKAGLVKGKHCPKGLQAHGASRHSLDVILEPEAASIYCQQQEGFKKSTVKKGDKLLVADVGGGTLDFVVHEKSNDDPESAQVKEVMPSFGEIGGGTFVDRAFAGLLSKRIGCFEEICQTQPEAVLSIFEWWESQKKDFEGPKGGCTLERLDINHKISVAWKNHDKEKHGRLFGDDEYYSEMKLEAKDFQEIFDTEVNKVVKLIKEKVEGVKVLMVVGGFARSQYLQRRIREELDKSGYEGAILNPPGCEVAICIGAVQLHLQKDSIEARISRKTYGIATSRPAQSEDPPEGLYTDEDGTRMCRNCFKMFVERGARVLMDQSYAHPFTMTSENQKVITVSLYSSDRDTVPRFVSEVGCVLEGDFKIDVSQDVHMGRKREVEVRLHFGASSITVSALRKNFGDTHNLILGDVLFNDPFSPLGLALAAS